MAITLTSQLTNVNLDPGSPNNLGTGNAQQSETVIQLEGANAAATGHSGSVGPVSGPTIANLRGMEIAGNNVVRTDTHLHIWVRDLYPIRDVEVGGVSIYLNGGQACLYHATGLNKGYAGGWFHYIVNLDPGDRPAASVGTLPTGNIVNIGYEGNISASKGEDFLQNCYFDAIRSGTGGQGITLTGGASGARHTFKDCADADANNYGILRDVGGSLRLDGCVTFGAATLTTWIQDLLGSLKFTDFTVNNGTGGTTVVPAVASDYYRVILADATTGVSNMDLVDYQWLGVSRAVPFRFTVLFGVGDAYTSLRSTYLFGEVVTLNAQCTSDHDSFIECQTIIPGGITLTAPAFSNTDAVTLTAASDLISGGDTNLHNTAINVAFITTDDVDKIENHHFDNTGGLGHAVEATAIGTFDWDGNTLAGYGGTPGSNLVAASGDSSAAFYNNSGGLITLNILNGGSIPSVRNGAGATTVIANAVTLTVTAVDIFNVPLANIRVAIVAEESKGTITIEDELVNALTNGAGQVSTSLDFEGAFGAGLAVSVRGRSSSPPATRYVYVFSPQLVTAGGLLTTIQMREDDVADDTN